MKRGEPTTDREIERAVDFWSTPPIDRGQTIDIAYGAAWEDETLWRRTTDRSSRTTTYARASTKMLVGIWEPWNKRPVLKDTWTEFLRSPGLSA